MTSLPEEDAYEEVSGSSGRTPGHFLTVTGTLARLAEDAGEPEQAVRHHQRLLAADPFDDLHWGWCGPCRAPASTGGAPGIRTVRRSDGGAGPRAGQLPGGESGEFPAIRQGDLKPTFSPVATMVADGKEGPMTSSAHDTVARPVDSEVVAAGAPARGARGLPFFLLVGLVG
ncbi:MAG: bacterial transcriptional activator domain-containing protein [Nocardioides sp.]